MAFADSISEQLSTSGINVGADLIPSREIFSSDLDSLASWLASLDEGTRAATDQITGDNPVKAIFADPEVGIVSAIGPILAAFDAAAATFSIIAVLDMLKTALGKASD